MRSPFSPIDELIFWMKDLKGIFLLLILAIIILTIWQHMIGAWS